MLVCAVNCVFSPCAPPFQRPAMLPAESAKMRGMLTILASCGRASGTWITSMRKSEVLGSCSDGLGEQPSSSVGERTLLVPDTYTYTFALSFGSTTSVCVCEPRHVCTAATCFG